MALKPWGRSWFKSRLAIWWNRVETQTGEANATCRLKKIKIIRLEQDEMIQVRIGRSRITFQMWDSDC